MRRLYLILAHAWAELCLWQAEIDDSNAGRIAADANTELDRALALCAHNARRLQDARERVMYAGYAIDKLDRQREIGI